MEAKYTILEAARAAGISKNTAKYRLTKAPEGTTYKGPDGLIYVSAAGAKWLKETAINQDKPPVYESVFLPSDSEPAHKPEEPAVHEERTTDSKTSKPPKTAAPGTAADPYIELLKATIADQAAQIQEKEKQISSLLSQMQVTSEALQKAQDQAATITAALQREQEQSATIAAALQKAQELAGAAQAIHAGEIQKSLLEATAPETDQSAAAGKDEPKKPGFLAWLSRHL